MARFPGFSSPCQNGVAHPFHYPCCYHNRGADERDKRCAICYVDYLDNDCTTTHGMCNTTFHTSCLDLYAIHRAELGITTYTGFTVETGRRDLFVNRKSIREREIADPLDALSRQLNLLRVARDGVFFPCPVCQAVCQAIIDPDQMNLPEYVSRFRVAEDVNVGDIVMAVRRGKADLIHIPRSRVLGESRDWQTDLTFRKFYNRHVLPQSDGERPTFDIPEFDPDDRRCVSCEQLVCACGVSSFPDALRDPSHFDPFFGSRTTQAGIYLFEKPGESLIILLTPQQNYNCLTVLSRVGLVPALVPGFRTVCLNSLRGCSFRDIVLAAHAKRCTCILAWQFHILFPELLRNGSLLHVVICGMVRERLHIAVAVGTWTRHWNGPQIFETSSEQTVQSALDALGGTGSDIVVSMLPSAELKRLDRCYKKCALVNRRFGDFSLRTSEVTNDDDLL